jgi:hypothetical protein
MGAKKNVQTRLVHLATIYTNNYQEPPTLDEFTAALIQLPLLAASDLHVVTLHPCHWAPLTAITVRFVLLATVSVS